LIPDPSNPQAWNRYSYVMNRPVNFNDPTGHAMDDGDDGGCYPCTQLPDPIPDPDDDDDNNPTQPDDDIVYTFDTDDLVEKLPFTVEQWTEGAKVLNEIALAYDTILGIYVLAWTGIGLAGGLTFEGNPVTGAVGAAAGYIIGEGTVAGSNALFPGNIIASLSTTAGLVADMKSGNTSIDGSLSISSHSINLSASGEISSGALRSVVLTGIGWGANIVTLSLPLQAASVANDRGWFPSTSITRNINLSFP
jgi:hypothetical protein